MDILGIGHGGEARVSLIQNVVLNGTGSNFRVCARFDEQLPPRRHPAVLADAERHNQYADRVRLLAYSLPVPNLIRPQGVAAS